ncbi:ZPR1-type Zinc finger containing protein [Cryptosporidium tyzzeri]|nr:ZPR1-type Zinc finger containing protein [Cryptosporidium tyzzeri]
MGENSEYSRDDDTGLTIIQSLCMNCHKEGETKLLLTSIPQFRDVILMSFECPHCGFKNNEIQSGGVLQDKGECIELVVTNVSDLDRQIVKSEFATISILEQELDIPPSTQKGVISTIEGIITKTIQGLSLNQEARIAQDQEVGGKIEKIINNLKGYLEGKGLPFTIKLDDPSGNSFIQNPIAPLVDHNMKRKLYDRTKEQLEEMGYYGVQNLKDDESQRISTYQPKKDNSNVTFSKGADIPEHLIPHYIDLNKSIEDQGELGSNEDRIKFDVPCPNCGNNGESDVCEIDIPGFRRCLIMAFVCNFCGIKTNELKPSGAYGELAKKWILTVESELDLNRDILKSDTASIEIPEIELEMGMGSLGSLFTTVEGMIVKITDSLKDCFTFQGDSTTSEQKKGFQRVIEKLENLLEKKEKFTLIIDDAADHSFIGKRIVNGQFVQDDQQLKTEKYQRTDYQNEALGINDIKVENYSESEN